MGVEVRDTAAEREASIKAKIKLVESEGGDTSHLKSLLKAGDPIRGRVNVQQPMPPGTAIPGQPLSPEPVGQPEPADGSAEDKRKQDNSPVREGAMVTGPKDPGPELKRNGGLPDYLPEASRPDVKKNKPGALPEQQNLEAAPTEGKSQEELQREAKAKDRRRDRAEAEGESPKVDANPASPIVPAEAREAEGKDAAADVKKDAPAEVKKDSARAGNRPAGK